MPRWDFLIIERFLLFFLFIFIGFFSWQSNLIETRYGETFFLRDFTWFSGASNGGLSFAPQRKSINSSATISTNSIVDVLMHEDSFLGHGELPRRGCLLFRFTRSLQARGSCVKSSSVNNWSAGIREIVQSKPIDEKRTESENSGWEQQVRSPWASSWILTVPPRRRRSDRFVTDVRYSRGNYSVAKWN